MSEKIVSARSSLTRAERNSAANQSRAERGLQPGYVYRGRSYEAMRDRAAAAAASERGSIPFKPRPSPGPNPYNMGVPAGTPPATIPTGLNPDGSIPGVLTGSQWGARIPVGDQSRLKAMVRKLGRYGWHPWLRALDFALDAYDAYKFWQAWNAGPAGYNAPGFTRQGSCGGGPGVLTNMHAWLDPNTCPPSQYNATGVSPINSTYFPYWMRDFSDLHPFFGWPMNHPAFHMTRNPGTSGRPVVSFRPYPPTNVAPMLPAFPTPNVPTLPLPLWNPFLGDRAAVGPQPMTNPAPRPTEGWQNRYDIPPVFPGPPHKNEPPPKGNKERKVRVSKLVMAAWRAALAYTEAADLAEALFKALPKSIRDTVPKTGRTDKRARIGAGKAYATPVDKALWVYKHFDKLDLEKAVAEVAKNQIEDWLIGNLNAGADKARDRIGGIGWGQLLG